MIRLQGLAIGAFLSALAGLVWSLFYALSYDVRSSIVTRKYELSKSFITVLSDDIFAPARHAASNWPSLHRLSEWPRSFIIQNSLIALVPVLLIVAATLIVKSKLAMPNIHGDARLLKLSELGKAGLNKKHGLILGQATNTSSTNTRATSIRAIDGDQSHCLVIGPPASGKTEAIVIPNLIEWTGSFIALDFKGTLFERTSKIRKRQGDAIYVLAPGLSDSHTYNPLDLLRRGPHMVTDIQALAGLLIPVNDAKEAHWNQSAQMLLSGLLGYVLESKECESGRTLSSVVDLFSATKSFITTCKHMITEPEISDWTRARIIEFMAVPEEEAGSIRSTLNRHLMPWQNPAIVALTSTTANAIPLSDIRKTRMAVYLIIDTGQIDVFAPLLKLFLEQVNSIVNRDYRQKQEHKILFMIDEFYQLGRVKSIVNQLPFARDRDIRIVLVSQGIAQIDEKFGRDGRESIMASCALKLFCSFNDKPTVDLVTHMLGNATQRITTVSRQMPVSGGMSRKTRNESYAAKPLFRPDDLYTWPRDDLLVLKTNSNPLIVKKILADKTAKYTKAYKLASKVAAKLPKLPDASIFLPSWSDKRRSAFLPVITSDEAIEREANAPVSSERIHSDGDMAKNVGLKVVSAHAAAMALDDVDFDGLWSQCETMAKDADQMTSAVQTSDAIEDKGYTLELFADLVAQMNGIKALVS